MNIMGKAAVLSFIIFVLMEMTDNSLSKLDEETRIATILIVLFVSFVISVATTNTDK